MTPERKQRIMALVADENGHYYYNGPLDGIWGPESQKAAERFIRDFAGATTEESTEVDPWEGIEYFRPEEFKCKCGKHCDGYPAEIDMTMVRYADAIRKQLGLPLIVNSGLRCKQHNANVGGVKNSQHVLGTACDLGAPKGITPEKMARVAEEVIGNTGGIGIYGWGIHIDSRTTKARWRG